jgi:H+-transporting ATPase
LLSKIQAKKTVDLTPDIATRAYEIYEERGRHDGQADQDWIEAETEIRKSAQAHAKAGSR